MTHESWKSSRKMTTHLWNRSLIWEWAHGSGSNSIIMFLSLFLESHTVQWQCRKVRVGKGKNAMNITMKEGKSAMNILLFYSTTLFLNSPEHWHAWHTSVIGTTVSMGQRMWTKLIALWTPSRKQLRCYLGTLLKRPRGNAIAPCAFSHPSLRIPFTNSEKKNLMRKSLDTGVARNIETWVFQGPNLGREKERSPASDVVWWAERRHINITIASQEGCSRHIHIKCLNIQELDGILRVTITYLNTCTKYNCQNWCH